MIGMGATVLVSSSLLLVLLAGLALPIRNAARTIEETV
jgi:hypothetical protein